MQRLYKKVKCVTITTVNIRLRKRSRMQVDLSFRCILQPNKRLTKKLPKQCEAANLLVGQVDFLSETVMALCRLDPPSVMADLTEVALPTRFVFVVLSPTNAAANTIWENSEMARSLACLLTDKVCSDVAAKK